MPLLLLLLLLLLQLLPLAVVVFKVILPQKLARRPRWLQTMFLVNPDYCSFCLRWLFTPLDFVVRKLHTRGIMGWPFLHCRRGIRFFSISLVFFIFRSQPRVGVGSSRSAGGLLLLVFSTPRPTRGARGSPDMQAFRRGKRSFQAFCDQPHRSLPYS